MKTILFFCLLILAGQYSFGQVAQRRIVNAPKTSVIPVQAEKKEVIFLNKRSPRYQQAVFYGAKGIAASKLSGALYNKDYSYPDGTKIRITLHRHPSFATDATSITPKVVNTANSNTNGQSCTTTTVSLTATSTDFMNNNYSAQAAHIYPGAIYSFDNLYSGDFREENQSRNPIIIGTADNANVNGSTYETVTDPNQFTITNAIAALSQRFSTSGAANGSTSYQIFESDNSSDLNLKLGAGGSGYGFSFDGFVNTQNKERKVYLTIDARKTLFTISTSHPDSGFFKVPRDPSLPVGVIGSVSYGARALANLELTFQSQQDAVDMSAAYNGFGVSGHVDFGLLTSKTSVSSQINAYMVGGPSTYSTISFDKTQLESKLQDFFANVNYQNAKPISYELYDLDGNIIGCRSTTDNFQVPLCIPQSWASATLHDAWATIVTGNNQGDNKDRDTHYSFGIFDSNNTPVASFHDDSNNDEYKEGSNSNALHLGNQTAQPFSFKNFMNGGGRVHINIAPVGHDTWHLQNFQINLNFSMPDGSQSTLQLSWNDITLSEGTRDVDLPFKYDSNSNKLIALAY